MSETSPAAELLLLATQREVYAFDLTEQARVTIGRHESNDLHLASRTVSNFHAEVVRNGVGYVIRDLGSTNGTFVNGRQVETGTLANGDRIRLGNHVVTLQLERFGETDTGLLRCRESVPSLRSGDAGGLLFLGQDGGKAGTVPGLDPNDFTLPDLLKALCQSDAPVRAELAREGETATVWVRTRRVLHAEYGEAYGEKALFRLFRWREGNYEITDLSADELVPRSISLPVDALIMEGMKSLIELVRLTGELPPLEARLRLKEDCPLPLTAHSPEEIEMFQLIIRHETIARVLEHSSLTDVRILRLVDALLSKGVFETRHRDDLDETVHPIR